MLLVSLANEGVKLETNVPTSKLEQPGSILACTEARLQILNETYDAWHSGIKRLAVATMSLLHRRFVDTVHEHVLLHSLCCGKAMRAHAGVAHDFHDCAWRKYNGIVKECLLFHVRRGMMGVEELIQSPQIQATTLFGKPVCLVMSYEP